MVLIIFNILENSEGSICILYLIFDVSPFLSPVQNRSFAASCYPSLSVSFILNLGALKKPT